MTRKEILESQIQTKESIESIEKLLSVSYWYYDNTFKIYRFRIKNCEESLDLPKSVMIALSQNDV